MSHDLHFELNDLPARSRATVAGEVDMASSARLADQLAALIVGTAGDIELDLSAVTFCDSSGLRVVLDARAQLSRCGRHLRIVAASPQVERLLSLTGTSALFLAE